MTNKAAGRNGATARMEGMALLLASALAFSTAGAFTRAVPVPLWPMVFWRNLFGSAGLLLVVLLRGKAGLADFGALGRRGWAAIVCSAFATVCYLAAFARTGVADIAITYAAAPMITAGLAWLILRERPTARTLAAAVAALAGVALTVAGSASTGAGAGDALALLMTLALSVVAILARGGAVPALATALGSTLLSAIAVLPAALATETGLGVGRRDATWLAAFGIVTMTIALPTYLAGVRRVPAARAMLISAAEMPFAPLWAWLAFGECPRTTAVAGGALVLAAVLYDIMGRSCED